MDFLKQEIERKKRQIAEKNVCKPNKKYFKRGDLAAIQEAEYLAKYGPSIEDIEELEAKKKDALQEKGTVDAEDALYPLPREDVITKLRDKGEPILIFGETENQANLRLRSLEIGEGDSFKVKNTGNNFVEALKKVDKEYLKAFASDDATSDDKNKMELKLYNTNRTWSEALFSCIYGSPTPEIWSTLASVHDNATNEFLTNLTGGAEWTWVGGYQLDNDI